MPPIPLKGPSRAAETQKVGRDVKQELEWVKTPPAKSAELHHGKKRLHDNFVAGNNLAKPPIIDNLGIRKPQNCFLTALYHFCGRKNKRNFISLNRSLFKSFFSPISYLFELFALGRI